MVSECKRSRRGKAWLAIVAMLLVSWPAVVTFGQSATGSLVGVVADESGAPVPGVRIIARHAATAAEQTAESMANGQYVLRGLAVGLYTVTAELQGFATWRNEHVVVRVGEDVRLDARLQVGDVSETVAVHGGARTVDTTTSTLQTVIDQQRIETLPLNGRNPTQLMQLVPGVQPDPRSELTSGATYPGVEPISAGGGRGNTTNFVLDGGTNNDHYSNAPNPMPNPDALQEFSVQTNNFSAQYGRNAGAVVNAVTRSGSNALHALAFGYFRNHDWNATNYFTPGVDDGLTRKQLGGTAGGPIVRNRTFFFFSYQGTRERSLPLNRTTSVPTEAQRRGDFSSLSTPLRNPATGQPYPGNRIPQSDLSPIAQRILQDWVPLPNGDASSPNLLRMGTPSVLDDDQTMVRVDQQLSANHRIYGRIWRSGAETPSFFEPGNALAVVIGRKWTNTVISVNDSWVLSPSLVNNLVVTSNRTDNENYHDEYPPQLNSIGVNIWNDDRPQWQFNVGGFFNMNTLSSNEFARNELQVVDTLRWTRGSHEISMGVDYSYGSGDITNNLRQAGAFVFNNAAPFTGNALADFLVGKFSSFEQGLGEYKNTRMHYLASFVEDTFRVSARTTLTLGLRWDPFFPYTDVNGRLAAYRPGQQSQVYVNAPPGALYPGDPGFPDGGYEKSWGNVGPRLGFAHDLSGDGRSSIRAGYGIFYDRPNTIATNSAANQGPFGTLVSIQGDTVNSLADPYAGRPNPFPADPFNVPSDVTFVQPHVAFSYDEQLKNARLQSWHTTYEREVLPGAALRVAYAGSHGDRLAVGRELNPATYAPGATTATTNQRRPLYPLFGSITSIESTGRSSYHSLQIGIDKRMSRGLSVLANYTLSRSLDDSSFNKQTGATQTNPFDNRFDWGPANFDRRHRFVASWLWEVPGRFSQPVLAGVLSGWSVSGIFTLQSGLPFSVTSGVDNARTGTGSQRADLTGDPDLPSGRSREEQTREWFNTAAFATNALGTFGSSSRNALRGPSYSAVDLGLQKTLPLHGQLRAQLRLDAFNLLNQVNLGMPDASRSSNNFGRILSADDPRILQLAVRLSF